jgi:hypothetical protein
MEAWSSRCPSGVLSLSFLLWSLLRLWLLILLLLFSYHSFSFSWYFSSWGNGEPHHLGFKPQTAACSTSCTMCDVPSMAVLELFPDSFVNFHLQFPWLQRLSVWQSISCSTYAKFLCRIKLSLQPFCFSPFLQVLGCCAFYLFCVTLKRFLEVWGRLMRVDFERVLQFASLDPRYVLHIPPN